MNYLPVSPYCPEGLAHRLVYSTAAALSLEAAVLANETPADGAVIDVIEGSGRLDYLRLRTAEERRTIIFVASLAAGQQDPAHLADGIASLRDIVADLAGRCN